ncbi:MAG: tRNA (adenosine(37)-N6)-threonylcarbamoyltransferase complex dimerization subunit type 1 TsaB [Ruminococcaceae bacterium]|nr:tRNA (adenosine(37)-N6)-threonylcarbamoyltransferase complex dimerization subunit type 1 TsaB [Oscillospiraceae bacterium]
MKILAIDTSSLVCSAAVCEDGSLLGEYTLMNGLTHSQKLMPLVNSLLEALSLDINDIDVFAVTNGPGSFTGLRIGIATVKGFAFVKEKPVVAVSTLEAMAYNVQFTDYLICPLMDARAGQVYCAAYRRKESGVLETVINPEATEVQKLISELEKLQDKKVLFLGDGVKPNLETLKGLGERAAFSGFNNGSQRAASVLLAAYEKAVRGEFINAEELNAEYLRKSQAERERVESGVIKCKI